MNHENIEVGDDYVGYNAHAIYVLVDESSSDVGLRVDDSSTILILTDELAAELSQALVRAIGPREKSRAVSPSHARWA
jgi:hypothetical protein